jgi:hypothetical protein
MLIVYLVVGTVLVVCGLMVLVKWALAGDDDDPDWFS